MRRTLFSAASAQKAAGLQPELGMWGLRVL